MRVRELGRARLMPGAPFLAGIATCAVQLIEVFAQEEGMPLEAADAAVWGDVDASNQPRPDVTLFTSVASSSSSPA